MQLQVNGVVPPHRGVDQSQLHQSRFGLVFQACMLMITVCFLFSDVLGGFWKNRCVVCSVYCVQYLVLKCYRRNFKSG